MEEIRKLRAMNRLISDSAKAEVIKDWQSGAHQQHQNTAESGWQPTKSWSNINLNISEAPPRNAGCLL
jgi:methylmalonyl-CoA mutase N-terminal domain/subunit